MNKLIRLHVILLLVLLSIVSCYPYLGYSDLGYLHTEFVNNSDEPVYVGIYGHEVEDISGDVIPVSSTLGYVAPGNIAHEHVLLNWDLEDKCKNIWWSYGIDTVYVLISKNEIPKSEAKHFKIPTDNNTLKVIKYTRSDLKEEADTFTIVYP